MQVRKNGNATKSVDLQETVSCFAISSLLDLRADEKLRDKYI